MNRRIRGIVDAAMYVLMLLLMGQCVLRGTSHEWMGIATGILFIAHNALNYKWYQTLFRGKYSPMRIARLVINFLLIIAVLACMASGILISQHVFSVGSGSAIEFGRWLHLVATACAFVLMTVHFGLHWPVIRAIAPKIRIGKNARRRIRIAFCMLAAGLCAYGLYQFIDRRFWEELFHLIDYQKEYDYTQSLFGYFMGTASLSACFIATGNCIRKLFRQA